MVVSPTTSSGVRYWSLTFDDSSHFRVVWVDQDRKAHTVDWDLDRDRGRAAGLARQLRGRKDGPGAKVIAAIRDILRSELRRDTYETVIPIGIPLASAADFEWWAGYSGAFVGQPGRKVWCKAHDRRRRRAEASRIPSISRGSEDIETQLSARRT